MSNKQDFFNSIDYPSIIDNIKGIYTSDGSMSILMDFERCLDEADLYAFRNWELGELVAGPNINKYTVDCTFMFPYKNMPDPRGAKRLMSIGCKLKFKKTKIKVPVKVEDESDFIPNGHYPKSKEKRVWLVFIQLPKEIMDDVRQGSIELADQTVDLEELDDSFDDDLDKATGAEEEENPELEQGPAAAPVM